INVRARRPRSIFDSTIALRPGNRYSMDGKPIYAVGLDAGSNRTRFVIGVLEPSGLRVIGFGQSESQGWVKGRIADQRTASESILRAVREAEAAAQMTVEAAVA